MDSVESPMPGLWECYADFRWPENFEADQREARGAFKDFLAEVAEKLSNLCYEFRFDEANRLLYRRRLQQSEFGVIYPGPLWVYRTICKALTNLQIGTPGPYGRSENGAGLVQVSSSIGKSLHKLLAKCLPTDHTTKPAT